MLGPAALIAAMAAMVCCDASADANPGAPSQSQQGPFDRELEKISKYISIQKSFKGSLQDSQAPANIAYDHPDQGPTYSVVDFGIKSKNLLPPEAGKRRMRWTAMIAPEWHRTTYVPNPNNKVSMKGTVENQFIPNMALPSAWFSDVSVDVTRDFVLNQTSRALSVLEYYFSEEKPFRADLGDRELLHWGPTFGVERFENLALKQMRFGQNVIVANAINGTFGSLGLNGQLGLFPNALDRALIVTATETWRTRLATTPALPQTIHLFSGSLDYYFDREKRFGVGLTYQRGRDPVRNFLEETTSTFGFKFQLASSGAGKN